MNNAAYVVAPAAERDTFTRGNSPGHTQETNCLNCGAGLDNDYCGKCGQHAHVPRTVGAVWHDLKHGVLHLDGKLARTLPLLVVKPGELTRRYAQGERKKFVSPLAMFLFAVFLLFLVMQIFHMQLGSFDEEAMIAPSLVRAERSLGTLADGAGSPQAVAPQSELAPRVEVTSTRDTEEAERQGRAVAALPHVRAAIAEWDPNGNFPEIQGLGEGNFKQQADKLLTNPALALYKLQANSYKFSWALIPLSVPFVWLLFAWKRRFTIYDHTVFVTYSLAFATLLATALIFAGRSGIDPDMLVLLFLLVMPVHQFLQLRGAYKLRKRSALWRLVVLQVLIIVIIALFGVLIFGLGLL